MMFEGKTVLVTGGSRGIGRDVALRFAENGAKVAISYATNREAAEETRRQSKEAAGRDLVVLQADLADVAAAGGLIDRAVAELGGLDILVNNHGLLMPRPLDKLDPDDWRKIVDTNLTSTLFLCQRAAPPMRERGWGRIVNVSSMAGKTGGVAGVLPYATAKAGVIALTKGLALDLAPHGVTVNCVAPALVETDMLSALPTAQREALAKSVPVGRMGRPREVSHAVLFLAHEDAAFITGETINVNGGRLMD